MRTLYIHFELFNIYNMEKKDILESLVNYYTNGNKAKFAAKLGIKPQTINTWLGRNSFDIELIYSKCEYLSGDWLLSGGEGEMLRATKIIKADNGSIATGDNSSVHGNATNVTLADVAVMQERIKSLEALLEEKERLIRVYEKMNNFDL